MSLVLEFLNHFFALDWQWFVGLALDNLLWLFILAAVAAFFYEKRNWFWATVFIIIYVFASTEFAQVVGWSIFNKDLLSVLMIAAVGVLAFAENDAWGSKHLALLNTLRFIVIMAIFNLFFM